MTHYIKKRNILLASSAAIAVLAISAPAFAQNVTSNKQISSDEQTIIVTGTRDKSRTKFDSLTPVDVISGKALQDGASTELADNLAQVIPSFTVHKLPSSDGLQFVRPAHLRGLSSDQTLVLLNGKRFHRSAFLGQRGAQGPDLSKIPSFGVGRIEVLRDGASAQYGSDAIAGVINIQLDNTTGFSAYAQGSQYFEGDGDTTKVGVKGGIELGEGGYLTGIFEYGKADITSRTHQRADAIAYEKETGVKLPNPVQKWGTPETENYNYAINFMRPIADGTAQFYGFATYADGNGINDINWRIPSATANASVYKPVPIFPNWNVANVYPLGFTPREAAEYKDYQTTLGMRGDIGEDFSWDISVSEGENETAFYLYNSINASMGPDSPFDFYLGTQTQHETNLNADGVYKLNVAALPEPINIGFGVERRQETYTVKQGDKASYEIGAGAQYGLAVGSNGFPGFSDIQAGEWDQTSNAAYVDIEASLTRKLVLGGAVRYEDFNTFGDTTNGKISARYEFTPDFALRASYSTGFRAPTVGQVNSLSTSQGLDTVTLQLYTAGRISPENPLAVALGAKPLTPEKSKNLSAGFVWNTPFGLSGSVDAYRVDVDNRISSSSTIKLTADQKAELVKQGYGEAANYTSVYWFTNDYDTRTQGVDVVATYIKDLWGGKLNLTGAYNYNETTIRGGSLNASATQKRLFEENLPKNNATFTATLYKGDFEYQLRGRYYGKWTDSSGNADGDIFQEFGSIGFLDASIVYHINNNFSVKVGGENILDTYPDKAIYQASRGIEYSRNAPYDSYGGQYYVRFNVKY